MLLKLPLNIVIIIYHMQTDCHSTIGLQHDLINDLKKWMTMKPDLLQKVFKQGVDTTVNLVLQYHSSTLPNYPLITVP